MILQLIINLTFWSPGLVDAIPGHAPPTVIAKYDPKPIWAPETIPSLKILDHEPAAFAAPAATAPSYNACGGF